MFAWEDDKIQEDPLFPRAGTGTREEQGKCLGSDTQVQMALPHLAGKLDYNESRN